EKDAQVLMGELISLGCKEIVIGPDVEIKMFDNLRALKQIVLSFEENCILPIEYQILVSEISDSNLQAAFGRLINYLIRTQKSALGHLQPVSLTKNDDFLHIDYNSRRNLELTETIRSKSRQGSLLWLLDKTKTAMGSRLLKQWIERPCINEQVIKERLDVVEAFIGDFMVKEELKQHLNEVYDLERLSGRIGFGNANARDLLQLNSSLKQIPNIKSLLSQLSIPSVFSQLEKMVDCTHMTQLLEKAIVENPPIGIKEGGIIKDGYNETLDEYRYVINHGKDWILTLEAQEREKTGIKSLKIKFNKVFGYYIEISKANLHLIPENAGYERKQTLVNAERFVTQELKEKENLILNAEEKSIQLEYELFSELRGIVKNEIPKIQQIAKVLAYFDVLQAFATMSEENRYTRPMLNKNHVIEIKDGRHPVVEKVLKDVQYVENDCIMPSDLSILLITGPNMSGKSTYMRQLALISIMAQIGCFVPASSANLPIFDQVFTRIGAADDLVSGHSTFMVEMMETNYALEHATKDSLILLDEIGRGTATFDGMALAQSIIEYVHDNIGAKTLFSTHYHELTQLEQQCPHLQNRHVRAEEHQGQLIFMHKVMEGPSDKSYGIHVAEIAKLPSPLITRAKELLTALEEDKVMIQPAPVVKEEPKVLGGSGQLSLFEEAKPIVKEVVKVEKKVEIVNPYEDIIEELQSIDLYQLTPMQAMNAMYEIKVKLNNRK
ncbi:DNA mismatch repair protein MutS, partial [Turicibacter sanguinis]|nr:DNA mismatch repair protein MutS [Turicibacter sanguinis]